MKSIALFFWILLSFWITVSFADTTNWQPNSSTEEPTEIIVKVTEKIPWGNCGEKDAKTGLYECKVKPGFKSVQAILWNIIKWITAIAALAGVLFIVINGIMLSMGWSGTDEVKKRIIKAIVGLILVLLSWLILNMIAPWVYK